MARTPRQSPAVPTTGSEPAIQPSAAASSSAGAAVSPHLSAAAAAVDLPAAEVLAFRVRESGLTVVTVAGRKHFAAAATIPVGTHWSRLEGVR